MWLHWSQMWLESIFFFCGGFSIQIGYLFCSKSKQQNEQKRKYAEFDRAIGFVPLLYVVLIVFQFCSLGLRVISVGVCLDLMVPNCVPCSFDVTLRWGITAQVTDVTIGSINMEDNSNRRVMLTFHVLFHYGETLQYKAITIPTFTAWDPHLERTQNQPSTWFCGFFVSPLIIGTPTISECDLKWFAHACHFGTQPQFKHVWTLVLTSYKLETYRKPVL